MRAVAAAFLVMTLITPCSAAAQAREVGVGVVLGEPIGASAKLWLDGWRALDFGFGLSEGNAAFWGDVLWHDWSLLPQPKEGILGAYLGVGPQIRSGDDARFGARAVGGVSYRLPEHRLEFFAEAGPLFRMTQGGHVDALGGVGVRACFGAAAAKR